MMIGCDTTLDDSVNAVEFKADVLKDAVGATLLTSKCRVLVKGSMSDIEKTVPRWRADKAAVKVVQACRRIIRSCLAFVHRRLPEP